ncbi:MAG: ATP-binding protein [Brucella sp.]
MTDEITNIDAKPTKGFFIDMLVRDIPIEQAILDLVDNSVDGAKKMLADGLIEGLGGRFIHISFNEEYFEIVDNCGGFDRKTAVEYAFRFGRPREFRGVPNSIGQFGIGMKRALFKFGKSFVVSSATTAEEWSISVDVNEWEDTDEWTFPWSDFVEDKISKESPGTRIRVNSLRSVASDKFKTKSFENTTLQNIKSKHRQFVGDGLQIKINGITVDATKLDLVFTEKLSPFVHMEDFAVPDSGETVSVKIIAGIGRSLPREAGWYVVCNGRVVLDADRRDVTGWGQFSSDADRLYIPNFHNQYARFRGIVYFESNDPSLVPWNTTKDDVDTDSYVWPLAFRHMMDASRAVLQFLNDLDKDIDDKGKDKSGLHQLVEKGSYTRVESITKSAPFVAPKRDEIIVGPRYIKIQYSKRAEDVAALQDALNLNNARAVGERSFDLVFSEFVSK